MDHDRECAPDDEGRRARCAGAAWLAQALQASRADTLATFEAYQAALGPALVVPYRATLNPPLWELGHIGWFQEFWLARNPERRRGVQAEPEAPRPESLRPGADALYHSSRVAHERRWSLPLPDADATRADLEHQLGQTLELLSDCDDDATSLYFHRLSLFHEDMHHEAALYMARDLGIAIDDPRWRPQPLAGERGLLDLPGGRHRFEPEAATFWFDNEGGALDVDLGPYSIDRRVSSWAEFLPFVEAGGYREPRWWTDAGRAWLEATGAQAPRYLRRDGGAWSQQHAGGWRVLALDEPAEHLSAHEAEAWCRWAGRRLPTEAEWEHAARTMPGRFDWGRVWEWTASRFAPFPGFEPHPYRDYSRPWFDGRPVLRGASYLTQPRMRHAGYRNFFTAGRNDIAAGFRSCAA